MVIYVVPKIILPGRSSTQHWVETNATGTFLLLLGYNFTTLNVEMKDKQLTTHMYLRD